MNKAPVVITVYDRLQHFSKTVESLAANELANETSLYVAIDAPYQDSDIAKNKEVIEYAKKIKGFKNLEIVIRESNFGAFKNGWMISKNVLDVYGKVIFTEDDNIFSRKFIRYINDGLTKYEDSCKVFSICSYLEPLECVEKIKKDTFVRPGFTSYGFGIWKNRFDKVDFDAKNFFESYRNPYKYFNFSKEFGYHIPAGLIHAKVHGKIFGDYAKCHHMFQEGYVCVFPKKSLVRNIGQDGSGLHSGTNESLQKQEIWEPLSPVLHEYLEDESHQINMKLQKYHDRSLFHKTGRYLQYIYHCVRSTGK